MIADLKSYPAMKDSGVPWLGEVPDHWGVRRIKTVFRESDRRRGDGDGVLLSLTRARGLLPQSEASDKLASSEDLSKYKVCDFGDLVMNRMQAWSGMFAMSRQRGVVSPDYSVFHAVSPAHVPFFEHLLKTPSLVNEFARRSKGIGTGFNRLYTPDFGAVHVPIPTLAEQTAIVRYLDYANARIRRYIRAKQQLIELLEEQRQEIIHRAITRGLDPNVPLKPSGVEWLGHIPEHWEAMKLGRLIELVTGFPFKSEGFTQDETDVRLLRGVNIAPGSLRWTDVVRWPRADRGSYGAFELRAGDIVLGMDRPIIQSGTRVARISEADLPALLLQRVARIRLTDELSGGFLTLLLAGKSFADYLTPIFTGISVPHLSPEQIKAFRLPLPSREEQEAIVQQVTAETQETLGAVSCAEREISLLGELRTRLIADLVTGKLDVREAAAGLPDELAQVDDADLAEVVNDELADDLDAALEEVEA